MTIATMRGIGAGAVAGALLLSTAALSGGAPVAAQSNVQDRLAELRDRAYEDSYAPLVEAVMPAVVAVRVERTGGGSNMAMPQVNAPDMREFFERFFGDQGAPNLPTPPRGAPPGGNQPMVGLGSGFIISEDGLVVTNAHVVGEADRVEVQLDDGRVLPAEVRGVDTLTDLALLEVEADEPLPYVAFGDSDSVLVGDKVLAIGNPFGLGGSVTSGIVSAIGRRIGSGPYDDFLQIDAPINRGNSGGPTFDLEGNVVGVNTAIFSPSGGSVGIGFAIAANLASEVIADLRDDGTVSRGWLGVGIQELTPELAQAFGLDEDAGGTVVTSVEPGSPADRAGFQTGDVITGVNGEEVIGPEALSRRVASLDPNTEATLSLLRDGDARELDVTLGERPAPGVQVGAAQPETEAEPQLGLALAPLPDDAREQLDLAEGRGVFVREVMPESPAAEAGLRAGDVILEVGRETVGSPDALRAQVREARESGEENVLVLFNRNGGQRFTTLPLAVS